MKPSMLSLLLCTATSLATPGQNVNLEARQSGNNPDNIMMFDCTDYNGRGLQDLCQNMCFGAFCAGNTQSLVHDSASSSVQRGRARDAGCRITKGSPCDTSVDECDEYPFKSVQSVSGGTRIHRCVPKQQNQDQAQIIKAFYGKNGYCRGKTPCSFTTGFENSGEIKYCQVPDGESCANDGKEFTKGGLFKPSRQARSLTNGSWVASPEVELFRSASVSSVTHATQFRTADGSEVIVPAGAQIGQNVTRMRIANHTAWNVFIDGKISAQAGMSEDELWADQNAPPCETLEALITFEQTTIAEQH